MDAMANRAHGVAKRFSGFATLTMRPTTVLAAKPGEKFLRIEVCPGYCDPIGRVRWMNSKLLSAARIVSVTFQGVTNQDQRTAHPATSKAIAHMRSKLNHVLRNSRRLSFSYVSKNSRARIPATMSMLTV